MNKSLSVRIMHWLVVLMFIFAIPSGYQLADTAWNGIGWINRNGIRIMHQTSGILSAILLVYWGIYRLVKKNKIDSGVLAKLAMISHISLIILSVAIALTGWMGSSAGNYGQALFGVIPMPNIIPTLSAKEAVWLYMLHEELIPYFIALLSLHVIAVFFHILVLKDGILRQMWFSKD